MMQSLIYDGKSTAVVRAPLPAASCHSAPPAAAARRLLPLAAGGSVAAGAAAASFACAAAAAADDGVDGPSNDARILSSCCPRCTHSKLGFNHAAADALDMRNEGSAYCCSSEAPACFCCCCSFVAQQHHTRCFITEIRFRNKSFGHARCGGDTMCRIGYIAKRV